MGAKTTRVLVAGWPSFRDGEATAGDVLAMEAVRDELAAVDIPCDLAWSPVLRPEGPSLDDADPARYTHLVFACGPVSGRQVTRLHSRFAGCRRIAIGVSVIDPADPAAAGFDVILPRDSPDAPPTGDLALHHAGNGTPESAGSAPRGRPVPAGLVPAGLVPAGSVPAGLVSVGSVPPGLVPAGPVPPSPVPAGHDRVGPDRVGSVASGPVASGPVASGPVASGPVASGPVASGPLPVAGVILVGRQREYADRACHEMVSEQVTERLAGWLGDGRCALVPLETRLDSRDWRLCGTPAQFEAIVGRLDLVVTTRLHGLVIALKLGVPALAVDPVAGGAKVTAQARAWRWPAIITPRPDGQLDPGRIEHYLDWCLSEPGRSAAAAAATAPPASPRGELVSALAIG